MDKSNVQQTLKHGLFLLAELPIGIAYFTIAVTWLALAVGLTPVFIGIPLFMALMGFAVIIGKFEYARCHALLGQMPESGRDLPDAVPPRGFWARVLRSLTDPEGWRGYVLMLAKLPLAIVGFTITVVLFAISLGLLAYPIVYYILLQTIHIDIYESNLLALFTDLGPWESSAIYFGLGFLFAYWVVRVFPVLSRAYLRATLQLLKL